MDAESTSVNVRVATPSAHHQSVNPDLFYGALSLLLVIVVFGAFAPTFYLRTAFNGPPVPPLAVVHGILATVWIGLVPVQAFLMRARQKALHRYIGWMNVGLAGGIVCLTPVVMLRFIPRLLTSGAVGGFDPRVAVAQIFISDVIALPVFAGMLIAAIRNRHRPSAHRRWIMYASLMLATPAPSRGGFMVGAGFAGLVVMPALAVVCAIFDRRTVGVVHPSTKAALIATVGHAVVPLVLSAFPEVVQLVVSLA